MYILFGYKRIAHPGAPEINVYGIFDTIDGCRGRVDQLDTPSAPHTGQRLLNVIHTRSYVFWYKNIENPECMNMAVSNSP